MGISILNKRQRDKCWGKFSWNTSLYNCMSSCNRKSRLELKKIPKVVIGPATVRYKGKNKITLFLFIIYIIWLALCKFIYFIYWGFFGLGGGHKLFASSSFSPTTCGWHLCPSIIKDHMMSRRRLTTPFLLLNDLTITPKL